MRFTGRVLRRALAASLLAAALCGPAHSEPDSTARRVTSGSPGLTISLATLQAGRTRVSGMANGPGVVVGIEGTAFQAIAQADRTFAFNLDFRTADCRVTLRTPTGTLDVVLSACSPMGMIPRGVWVNNAQYAANDVVSDLGSSWRALRANRNKRPNLNASDWQLFVGRGAPGLVGPAGPTGPEGAQGVPGAAGEAGPAGPAGPQGVAGALGPRGAAGARGPVGPAGPTGASGAEGPEGPQGPPGEEGDAGPPGPQGEEGEPGPAGPPGPQGQTGAQGPRGSTGARGPIGPAGPAGAPGAPGVEGPQGPAGGGG